MEKALQQPAVHGHKTINFIVQRSLLNVSNVSMRLVCASVGCGLGSLIAGEPKFYPKLGTVLGFTLGDFLGFSLFCTISAHNNS